ncbi:OsmC family protein [Pseudopedobacter saltans DSM 12145]|uniref:OsmC family protein n=1 Tax=Pseudopedobacter saltans (strain ATCC 51119 / DSM 12145 / JCM 21818 / CCUG 39354 / LMG 10337 / NBRC 100064 / NCIMB 13643) TaxID=762903 RepID=F0SE93_PSESL|nr:OsmC family protein [Pseudopedobacter saltans]ADY54015.1 OsmC family protein [Pseudopedobacter saltans DSM 12145]
MTKTHQYKATIVWTGNSGSGTSDYKSYERSHLIEIGNKPDILGSADPAFRGDANRHNPEDLLLSSLSSCHMLWYLHLCSAEGIIVLEYTDYAEGIMIEKNDGSGHFREVTLHPRIKVKEHTMLEKAYALHEKANKFCFIANSVRFPVKHEPIIDVMKVS